MAINMSAVVLSPQVGGGGRRTDSCGLAPPMPLEVSPQEPGQEAVMLVMLGWFELKVRHIGFIF